MIPLTDDNRQRQTFPWVNYALILVNVVVFLYELSLGTGSGEQLNIFEASCAITPADLLGGHSVASPCPSWITPLTAMFMHAGWAHILGNMLYLWIFGDNVEDAMGHGRYLVFYLICGLLASACQVAFSVGSTVPELGASGAIAGVLGAYLVLYPKARVNTLLIFGIFFTITRISAFIVIGLWIVLQFIEALGQIGQQAEGGVANWAHVGGFVAGLVLVNVFRRHTHVYDNYQWRSSF